MAEAMLRYFDGEKHGGVLLVAVGLVGLAAAALFFQPRWNLRSLAWTLAVLAILEIALGAGLCLRTGPQVRALLAQLDEDRSGFFAAEGERMGRVQRTFVVVEWIELAVIVVAAAAAVAAKSRPALAGVALGLLLNASFLLAFDLVAERRGAKYLAAIVAAGSEGLSP